MKKSSAMIWFGSAAICFAGQAFAASTANVTYMAAKEAAATDYKVAAAKCDSLSDNPKDVCIAEAKAARITTEVNAKATYKNTMRSRTDARKAIAEANYSVAKAKCASQIGNPKDVCIREAKALKVAAVADAAADKKVVDARQDAREDKVSAEYKLALEKCNAEVGAAKESCASMAKTKYGK